MAAVVVSGMQERGQERIAVLMGAEPTTLAKSDPAGDIARLYAEIGRLRSESRLMALERQALSAKLADIQAGIDPVTTASIPRRVDTRSVDRVPSTAPVARRQVYPPVPASPAEIEELADVDSFEPSPPATRAEESPGDMDLAALAAPEARIADMPLTVTRFALEIGAGVTVEQLRDTWRDLAADHAEVLGNLEPTVVRQTDSEGRSSYRLLAGPLPNAADAMNACVSLAGRNVDCLPAVHQGEALAMQ